jgi:hypothetical protein
MEDEEDDEDEEGIAETNAQMKDVEDFDFD